MGARPVRPAAAPPRPPSLVRPRAGVSPSGSAAPPAVAATTGLADEHGGRARPPDDRRRPVRRPAQLVVVGTGPATLMLLDDAGETVGVVPADPADPQVEVDLCRDGRHLVETVPDEVRVRDLASLVVTTRFDRLPLAAPTAASTPPARSWRPPGRRRCSPSGCRPPASTWAQRSWTSSA
ncbi:MAG: hypothetical protein R2699_16415 [Acidimicrobiales bacterium]